MDKPDSAAPIRLDQWLWAARFHKTRSLAKQAIDSGHVRYDGERTKPGKRVAVGARLTVRQGGDDWEIEVRGLSDQRRGAPEARRLYEETAGSRERREAAALQRRLASQTVSDHRPTKQQRRAMQRFKDGWGS